MSGKRQPKPGAKCSKQDCKHEKTKTGHCNVVTCPNYWGDCDVHASGGTRGN